MEETKAQNALSAIKEYVVVLDKRLLHIIGLKINHNEHAIINICRAELVAIKQFLKSCNGSRPYYPNYVILVDTVYNLDKNIIECYERLTKSYRQQKKLIYEPVKMDSFEALDISGTPEEGWFGIS